LIRAILSGSKETSLSSQRINMFLIRRLSFVVGLKSSQYPRP
jgi:hypothetical protein